MSRNWKQSVFFQIISCS